MPTTASKAGTLVLEQYASAQIVTATTTLVKTGPGLLHSLIINTNLDAAVVTVYDALTATGTPLATITTSGTIPFFLPYDIPFATGLTIVTSAAIKMTVTFR